MKTKNRRQELLDIAFGPEILSLLYDDDVIEIMLNPDGCLWAESFSKGKFFTEHHFSAEKAENIIKLVAAQLHLIIDNEHPEIACELPKIGARFQGWAPPIAEKSCFVIRKHNSRALSLNDYVQQGSMTESQALQIREAVLNKRNIIIAGGAGSGKTTLANALLNELNGANERIIVLEDLPELKVTVKDLVQLRTSSTISMRDLVKGALRMRPDRIIIGEVRDATALELLKAWNTGHPGGICTIHANSAEAVRSRLEDLIQETVNIVPHRLIDEAIDVILFVQKKKNGRYILTSILAPTSS